ncbi:MAG: hypothetical protein K0R17_3707 [Rariglobus sp.]|jgi:hypothetical protein|nr:hypothetical protein [Rariglobus sp.]
MKLLFPAVLLTGALVAVAAHAQVTLIDDTFSDGGRTNGADVNDAQWHMITTNTATTTVTANALRTTAAAGAPAHPHAIAYFNNTTLGVGDTLAFSFTFTSNETNYTQGATNVRWGLFNMGGSQQSSDLLTANVNTLYQNTTGYSVFGPRTTANNPVQIYSRSTNTTEDTTPISTAANVAIAGATANTTVSTFVTTPINASLSLTRTVSGYDYSVGYAGTTFSGSFTTVTATTFNMVDIWAITNNSNSLTIDNVLVTYTAAAIPEPSSYALFAGAAGMAGALTLRRRGRKG